MINDSTGLQMLNSLNVKKASCPDHTPPFPYYLASLSYYLSANQII